ncbi:MAG: 1-deoxy-D-xylulose-5-phosphate synthase [Thermomicrobiales bacterium]|nr:1-deoxy-D-xylulose-5-phosphate synthase [Thermomicrobiales bacterium]
MTLLESIDNPVELHDLSFAELERLAEEIRSALIDTVTRTGGHLGASLGTVELAIALHAVFSSPDDAIVWDVGHQAYAHKLLTGRLSRFGTLRQEGGISGFLSRDESAHDAFGAGHASTAISAALGIAVAQHLTDPKTERRSVAVIGDGALTGGMAFEGLNNAGHQQFPFIVVLNDNEMSIAPNVGAISKYLDRMRTDKRYNRAKDDIQTLLEKMPQGDLLIELGKRWKDSFKEFVYHRMIWEELGFTYLGPVPGHDIRALVESLRQARQLETPVFLHVLTEKGKGFAAAEADQERGHSVSAKASPGAPPSPPKYQDVFAEALIELANDDPRIVAITAAMPTGTSLSKFAKIHPDRFFDVGIAEQHAVTFAGGLATQGYRPVCAIYSTFLQRAYDQIVHDICLQRLPVIFALDRAGFAGDDGRTHHGIFDVSYLSCLPGITIMAPKDERELRDMLKTAFQHDAGPVAIRYPRGAGTGASTSEPMTVIPVGAGELLRAGNDVAIISLGVTTAAAESAADRLAIEGIQARVINARFAKPLDAQLILDAADACGAVVTVEENVVTGGFGSAVLELLANEGREIPVTTLGVPDQIFEQASQKRLRELAGIDDVAIANAARQLIASRRVAATAVREASAAL